MRLLYIFTPYFHRQSDKEEEELVRITGSRSSWIFWSIASRGINQAYVYLTSFQAWFSKKWYLQSDFDILHFHLILRRRTSLSFSTSLALRITAHGVCKYHVGKLRIMCQVILRSHAFHQRRYFNNSSA